MRPDGGRPARSRLRRLAVALAAVATLLGAGLGPAVAGASAPTRTPFILYNGQHEQTADAIVDAFEAATGIPVEMRDDDEDTLIDEIVAEGENSPADVIYTENSLPLEYLEERGLLARLPAATLAHTPARYDSPAGDWVGVSARDSVIIYNPSLIRRSALPTSIAQLAEPRYRGLLAFAPEETDFQPVIVAYERAYGRAATLAWLRGIKANADGHIYPDNETIADEVNRGAVAFGVVNQYYWYRMRAEIGRANMHSAITYFRPRDPGYIVDVSGAAVLKSARDRGEAEAFVAFLVGRRAQEIIGGHSLSFEYPLADGVQTSAPETPFADLRPYPITIAELGDGASAIALLRAAGLL